MQRISEKPVSEIFEVGAMSDTCEHCAKPYVAKRYRQKFCSTHCRWVAWNLVNRRRWPSCAQCGAAFERQVGYQRFCSDSCRKRHWAASQPQR